MELILIIPIPLMNPFIEKVPNGLNWIEIRTTCGCLRECIMLHRRLFGRINRGVLMGSQQWPWCRVNLGGR